MWADFTISAIKSAHQSNFMNQRASSPWGRQDTLPQKRKQEISEFWQLYFPKKTVQVIYIKKNMEINIKKKIL